MKKVTMELSHMTLGRIEEMQEMVDATVDASKSILVEASVKITHKLMSEIQPGDTLAIMRKDGTVQGVRFTGLK